MTLVAWEYVHSRAVLGKRHLIRLLLLLLLQHPLLSSKPLLVFFQLRVVIVVELWLQFLVINFASFGWFTVPLHNLIISAIWPEQHRSGASALAHYKVITEIFLTMLTLIVVYLQQRWFFSHVVERVLIEIQVVITACEQKRVIFLLWFQIRDFCFRYVCLERLEVILVCLCVLNQVFLDRIVFIFVTIIVASKQSIEWKSIILHTVSVTESTSCPIMIGNAVMMIAMIVHWFDTTAHLGGTLSLNTSRVHLMIVVHYISRWVSDRICLISA